MNKQKSSSNNAEFELNNQSFDSLKSNPQKHLIPSLLSKKAAEKFLVQYDKFFFILKKKKRFKNLINQLSKKTLHELIKTFIDQSCTANLFRKMVKKRLLGYENVGFFYREEVLIRK